MAAARNPRMVARGPARLRLVRRGRPVQRPVVKMQARYKRIGPVERASNTQFNFTVRKIQNVHTKANRVLLGRTNKANGRTDWRVMSIKEYNRDFASRGKKGEGKVQVLTASATMLAKHPDVFTHLGHELGKSLLHVMMAA